MLKAAPVIPEGSLVYVTEGSKVFVRLPNGWSKLCVSTFMSTETKPRTGRTAFVLHLLGFNRNIGTHSQNS